MLRFTPAMAALLATGFHSSAIASSCSEEIGERDKVYAWTVSGCSGALTINKGVNCSINSLDIKRNAINIFYSDILYFDFSRSDYLYENRMEFDKSTGSISFKKVILDYRSLGIENFLIDQVFINYRVKIEKEFSSGGSKVSETKYCDTLEEVDAYRQYYLSLLRGDKLPAGWSVAQDLGASAVILNEVKIGLKPL